MKVFEILAFDKIDKCICKVKEIDFKLEVVKLEKDNVQAMRDLKDVIFLEYTGVEDMNSFKIYLGSVLEFKSGRSDNDRGYVVYRRAEFMVKLNNGGYYPLSQMHFYSKVVGNIYEDVSLLEVDYEC